MPNLKDLNRRISSLRNMQKVMRAMNMIATVKLGKLYALQQPLRVFRESRQRMVSDLADGLRTISHRAIVGYETDTRGSIHRRQGAVRRPQQLRSEGCGFAYRGKPPKRGRDRDHVYRNQGRGIL